MTRFPWACAELPQASPCGISPIMYIPQESRHFPALLSFMRRTETSDELTRVKRKPDVRIYMCLAIALFNMSDAPHFEGSFLSM